MSVFFFFLKGMQLPIKFLTIAVIIISNISCIEICPETNNPPQDINIDEAKTINPITFNSKSYNTINAGNKIFLTEDTVERLPSITSGNYGGSKYCPDDFIVPLKEDFQEAIKNLGSRAYSFFTDPNGLNMQKGKYYITNTKEDPNTDFNKTVLYIDENSLKFIDMRPHSAAVRCLLKIPEVNLIGVFTERDLNFNEKITIKADNKYLNGYLWKIDNNIFTTETIDYTFSTINDHKLEFWGKYINGTTTYLCEIIYVNKKQISNSQSFDNSKIKVIQTDFKMPYEYSLHFSHSNFPIAPRDNGGYYIAISDVDKYLHVLTYDKTDNLIKDFNTTEYAYPHDITATDYGFAIYMRDAKNTNHSYLNLYNKNYELLNMVQIMNNDKNDDVMVDSNLKKQIIRYEISNQKEQPVFGMRFMYRPDNGKLVYSRGRIFLIFAHYNYFLDDGGHTGDTVVTFNDYLLDMDFGITWGASHSLIQSATYDNKNHFWTAALSDAFPEGIKVEYTSKKKFSRSFDPVNKKYNSRISGSNSNLAGYIKGYHTGPADGKLGGILYFENYDLYCLVFANTPDDQGKIYIKITTWKFQNDKIVNNQTYIIKEFTSGNLMQLRAGKYGNDKIIIIYGETDKAGNNGYGNIAKGTRPKVFVISVSDMNKIVNDQSYNNLLMNTNEDLRTFRDGVLIWGGADSEGKLVIHKIGTPSLTDDDEDIKDIMTKEDVEKMRKIIENNNDEAENNCQIISGVLALIMAQLILLMEFIL